MGDLRHDLVQSIFRVGHERVVFWMNVAAFRIYENIALVNVYLGEGVGYDLLTNAFNVVMIDDADLFFS